MASALWRCPVFRCLLLLAVCVHSSEGELPRAAWRGVTLNGFWSNFQKGTYYSARECVEFISAHSSAHHILFSAFYPWNLSKKKKKEEREIWILCIESLIIHWSDSFRFLPRTKSHCVANLKILHLAVDSVSSMAARACSHVLSAEDMLISSLFFRLNRYTKRVHLWPSGAGFARLWR